MSHSNRPHMTTTTTTPSALLTLRDLAKDGHGFGYIAERFNLLGIPTPSGKPGAIWHKQSVSRLAKKYGIAVAYDPNAVKNTKKRERAVIRNARKEAEAELTREPMTLRAKVLNMVEANGQMHAQERRAAGRAGDTAAAIEARQAVEGTLAEAESIDEMSDEKLREIYGWLFRKPDAEAIRRIAQRDDAIELPPIPRWFWYGKFDGIRDEYEAAVRFGEVDQAAAEAVLNRRGSAVAKANYRRYKKLELEPVPVRVAAANKWLATVKGRLQSIAGRVVELEQEIATTPKDMRRAVAAAEWRNLLSKLPAARVEVFEAQRRVLIAERGEEERRNPKPRGHFDEPAVAREG